jgi:hypothetical protein
VQHVDASPTKSPKGGTEIASRALIVAVRPERARSVPPTDSAAIQRHKDEKSLAAVWDINAPTIRDQEGTTQQA